ncbi:5-(carboxyamino)imidazole ribonucleotide synthase [Reichenbachiella agarivorans]|uniref:N5-carboxyaminoimidazole ribonucleotide synthase n=1 Tax=Reichenbachiella agarivorans TaxID=2979464 RepID=A0ABY6CT93_9BACT|nr:5-(carboxyamino)imidazole ribonucleotide synthase [Reichenbachiella agarivorans]UXP33744.1 5-(carboxyamino)imidazole ribonucleotide synthase [Reichenbachiella agarivorans]
MTFDPSISIAVLGGGQLGRMMIQSAMNLNLEISCMDPDPNAPCKNLASHFVNGDITNYDEVLAFGDVHDVITVEIENVNVEALEELERRGKKVFPQPRVLRTIKDKGLQKEFYLEHDIPTSEFVFIHSKEDLKDYTDLLPAANKLRTEGYDGRGVQIIKTEADLNKGFDAPSILEKFVDYAKEISVIVARNEKGEISTFPVVELEYHPEQNLVEFLFSPSEIDATIRANARKLAEKVITAFDMVGLLAVEMFVMKDGSLMVNECAPRTHNSGHHTIEGNITSQFEQHIRAILNLPLGNTDTKGSAVMINLLGHPDHAGTAKYQGIDEAMNITGMHVHLYGKKITKPFRKMGHVTLVGQDLQKLKETARSLKESIKIIA